ncbi:MAG TPA: YheC/YheD family protein [Syntrophomonadaceae bacterium]|nr:YheC/YheD family protein [Syntrophomonadaceae bacterium]
MKTIGRISISNLMMDNLGIPKQQYIRVRAGNLIVMSELKVIDNNKVTYMLSPKLLNALYIKRKSLRIRYDRFENMIHLGPTIGVLATSLPNRSDYDPISTQAELIYLNDMGKKIDGQVFFFTPNCVNWDKNTIRGYVYKHNPGRGVWVPATFPLPDIVYDRISSRRSEKKYNSVKKQLMQLPYLKLFNPSFLNKWNVHQILSQEPDLKNNLPETMIFTRENMHYMLNTYKVLFVKPSDGSLGHGIIRVRRNNKGSLNYTVYRKKRLRRQADNIDEFVRATNKIRSDKPYIVQQGLDLATYRGSPFDFRIIYQKDSKGEWGITKKFVRVAAKGSNISNLSTGGRAETSKKILRYLFKNANLIEEKNEEISNLCYKVATTLEKVSHQVYGELGLDIGIDKSGHPWLIEVNSKPRKTTETEFSKTIVRNTFIKPLEYAVYLAGFTSE